MTHSTTSLRTPTTNGEAAPRFLVQDIRRTLDYLIGVGGLVEIRALKAATSANDRWRSTYSGYFDNVDKVIESLRKLQSASGYYVTLNQLDPDLLARRYNRLERAHDGELTSDRNVVRRSLLLVDIDPERIAGVSATDGEKASADRVARTICDFLGARGWPDPIIADSGNGYHLLYAIDEPTDDGGVVERVLKALSQRFSDDCVKVDLSVHNPARITKLYGTPVRKGDNIPNRPHRSSKLITVPEQIAIVDHEQLAALAEEATAANPATTPRTQSTQQRTAGAFDLSEWIRASGLEITEEGPYTNGNGAVYRWKLQTCPMCGESDKSAVIMRMSDGRAAFKCQHDRCSGKGWGDFRKAVEPGHSHGTRGSNPSNENCEGDELPVVAVPGGVQTISDTATQLGNLLAEKRTHFVRDRVVTRIVRAKTLQAVRPAEMASDFECVATVTVENKPGTFTESGAKLVMSSQSFIDALPPLKLLTNCPVLIERGGQLDVVSGYDVQSGIFANGPAPKLVPLDQAVEVLRGLLAGFCYASRSDRSRALAAIITPALTFGGLLLGRPPIDFTEADQSQTGKGYKNKITAAIYNDLTTAISQRRGGIGGLEEAFDAALVAGRTFIALDNIRGKLDSQSIESFCTEDTYTARCAYRPNTAIDPRRIVLMLTSNRAEATDDLANRASCVRILKQPAGYQYPVYSEGDLLGHVRANQPRYLGAVYAVIREWHARGKPRTDETRHDFRDWAQTLDWIVQNLLGEAPLMDGHRETQQRMTNQAMNWLRDVALATVRQGRVGEWLIANDLLEVIDTEGSIKIPGVKEGEDIQDGAVRESALKQIGRRMTRAFKETKLLMLDNLQVEREDYHDSSRRERHHYRVTRGAEEKFSPDALDDQIPNSGESMAELSESLTSPTSNHRSSAIGPADEMSVSIDPPDTLGNRVRVDNDSFNTPVTELSVASMGSGAGSMEACDRCGGIEYIDTPIHDGRSRRRDCARCGWLMGWPQWTTENGTVGEGQFNLHCSPL